jgi:hypothetical protein
VSTRVTFLFVLAGIVAGCGSHHPKAPPAAPPLVRWANIIPPALRVPQGAAAAAPCSATALKVVGQGFVFQSAPSGAVGAVVLRNAGNAPCRLTGRPHVRFVGAPRQPVQHEVALPGQLAQFPQVRRPDEVLLALRPGDTAVLTLDWSNWCVPGARQVKGKLIPPSAVRVTLAGGAGSLDVPYNAVTPCTRPGAPSTIGVHPFQPPGLPNKHRWTKAVFAGKIFTIAGGPGPLHGVRGGVLRYAVRLRNESRTTVRFANCPLIAEELAPRGTVEAHQLNCAGGTRRVAPGGSIRFEMRVRIPASAPTGVNGLFWVLDPLGGQNAETVARVIVTAP